MPPDMECRRDSPEVTQVKSVAQRVRVVVHRVGPRVVVIHRPRLIDDDALRLVVGHVDNVFLRRRNLDYAVIVGDDLKLVTLQITGRVGTITECFDGLNHVRLLGDDCLAKPEGPVEIVIQHLEHLGIVRQCDDRVIPILVWFEGLVLLQGFDETRRLDDLQRIGRCRQYDCEQIIGVQRDRTDEFLEFGLGQNHKVFVHSCRTRFVFADWIALIVDRNLGVRCR